MENLDSLISLVNTPGRTYPLVSLTSVEKTLQKARFYVNAEELDYV